MNNRRRIITALSAVLLIGICFVPGSTADPDDCLICSWVSIPDPDGGDPIEDHICLSLGDEVGWSECYECMNCTNCLMLFKCYWSWP